MKAGVSTGKHSEVLSEYPREVVHLRRQFAANRFGLVLGAGVGIDFKIPLWEKLVSAIAADPKVGGIDLLRGDVEKKSLPYRTEMLFQRFREKTLAAGDSNLSPIMQQSAIHAGWLTLCSHHIYANVDDDQERALKIHPYFAAMLPLVQGSSLTINFNFDDLLERSLAINKRAADKNNRGFEVVTDPWPQFRRGDSVIYHPHGIVPSKSRLMELPVDRFVFSESAYSVQYVGSRGHDSSFLVTHFARKTCLLLGCNLEDDLRNVLMRGAQINPGNYHYYIHFIENETAAPTAEQQEVISETNFNVYNLITLFLTREKIKALLHLINDKTVPNNSLKDLAAQGDVKLKYNFYLTGAIGVGKSTTANQLRSLNVLDEWLETRPEVLAKRWDQLNAGERKEADDWIASQFAAKNNTLRHLEPAISIVDRPPLDPLAFTRKEEWPGKATYMLDSICPNRRWRVEPGVVILFTGDPHVLSARVRTTGRSEYSEDRLADMQRDLLEIYKGSGIFVIDTSHRSILEVTKEVAGIIYRKHYQPFDLHNALLNQEERGNDSTS